MTDQSRRRGWLLVVLTCCAVALAGCAAGAPAGSAPPGGSAAILTGATAGGPVSSAAGSAAPALPDCTAGSLPTRVPGTLTIGTHSPGSSPWYSGDSPSSGTGLESAVGYAVAQAIGYDHDQVAWATIDRGAAAAGTATGFDIDLDQFTAPDAGTATADYSTGYFAVTDTLVLPLTPGRPPESAAALDGWELGTVTASGDTARRVTGTTPTFFSSADQALAALAAGAVAGLVLPTPAALAAFAAGHRVFLAGQLPTDPSVQPEQFKALLAKGSALTGCVSAAIDRLRVEGTLKELAHQWVDPLVPELS